ncbi:MAG TPA: YbaK/EbsC family protein [Actinomycetota bacterium]|nr:YbaK/EbsC family protein [Actinomycetota bacterium]
MRTSVDVHNFLLERGVPHELVPVRGRIRPDSVAAVLGLPANQVGRVSLLRGNVDGEDAVVAALVPADREVDPSRAAGVVGAAALEEVPAEEATDLTGFLNEAIPPGPFPSGTISVLDAALADEEVLYFPGGEPSSVLKIRTADLIRAVDATVGPVAT